jgi:hypothetical protein
MTLLGSLTAAEAVMAGTMTAASSRPVAATIVIRLIGLLVPSSPTTWGIRRRRVAVPVSRDRHGHAEL